MKNCLQLFRRDDGGAAFILSFDNGLGLFFYDHGLHGLNGLFLCHQGRSKSVKSV